MAVARSKTFAEFFAGIGLVHEALRHSGWHCLYANDIDEKKQQVYEARFGQRSHFHLGDVWDTESVIDRLGGRPFLATASFPCVDLSLAGNGKGLAGTHSSAFFGFVRVLTELGEDRPRAVLLENVTGLLTSHGGADFAAVARALADLGYWLDAVQVDAKYFVPQSRPRVFVVGLDEALKESLREGEVGEGLFDDGPEFRLAPSPIRPANLIALMKSLSLPTGWLALDLPTPEPAGVLLDSVIDLDDDQQWWDEAAVRKHHDMMSDRHREVVDKLLAEGRTAVGTIFRRKRNGKTRAEVRFDGVAGCLRTPRGGSARQIVVVVQAGRLRMRWMSPREYARLQGADDYPLLDGVTQMLFGFGDAVCVPVIRWIDAQILTPAYEAGRRRAKGTAIAG